MRPEYLPCDAGQLRIQASVTGAGTKGYLLSGLGEPRESKLYD